MFNCSIVKAFRIDKKKKHPQILGGNQCYIHVTTDICHPKLINDDSNLQGNTREINGVTESDSMTENEKNNN